jgi:excisionase family DNA binding protein
MVTEKTKPIDALAYTTAQAAQVTGRSHTRIKKAIRERELTARKDGRATIIERTELQRWLAAMPTIGRKPEHATAGINADAKERQSERGRTLVPPPKPRSIARPNALENNPRR